MRFSTNLPYLITYTASSASEQDEANPALRLASTRAGKMGLSCPLGIARCIPQGNTPVCHTKNPLLAKFVWSRWLDIGLDLFFFSGGGVVFMTPSRSINTPKKSWLISSHLDVTIGE